ncbi:MAG TPA: hypothetical protein VK941_06610, partial [Gillisia sp.]|nr:hypothetical protein [Gillisia sp.]
EVYNYGISGGQDFDFGDRKVNYFDNAFNSLINFEFKWNAQQQEPEALFQKYDGLLSQELEGFGTVNYLSSHDDGQPFDKLREKSYETASLLLLSPGTSQIYYGDETARSLTIDGTVGDATLRSMMNWEEVSSDPETGEILSHWQKMGKFRAAHPAVGAGKHKLISEEPHYFLRRYEEGDYEDLVVVGLNVPAGAKSVPVQNIFEDGERIRDAYSGNTEVVNNGKIEFDTPYEYLLLERE